MYKATGEQNLLQVPDSELLETPLKSAALVSALGMWVEKIIMTFLLILMTIDHVDVDLRSCLLQI